MIATSYKNLTPSTFQKLTNIALSFLSNILIILIFFTCSTGCKKPPLPSAPQGHFENMPMDVRDRILEQAPRAVAEYEPSESVLVSDKIAKTMNLPYRALEAAILDTGVRLIIAGPDRTGRPWTSTQRTDLNVLNSYSIRTVRLNEDPDSIWARDWAPIMAKTIDGSGVLLDFNYISSRPKADMYAQTLASKVFVSAKRLSVPLYLEGGNFQINSQGYCIVTDRVIGDNAERPLNMYAVDEKGIIVDGDLVSTDSVGLDYAPGVAYQDVEGNWRLRTNERFYNEDQVRQILKDYAGCQKTLIVPSMPNEPTRHVDVFLKFINDETLLMAQLDAERIEGLATGRQKEIAEKMLEHQQIVASMLEAEGFLVVVVPMPLPHIPVPESQDEVVVRSYVNALLIVSRNQKKTALVPSFSRGQHLPEDGSKAGTFSYPYVDESHIDADETKVKQIFESFGYEVKFINADWIVSDFGAIHCTTMQYPAL